MSSAPKRVSLVLGLALTATGVVIALSQSPAVVARTNAVPITGAIVGVTSAYEACEKHEVLPSGTSAIRLSVDAMFGPRIHVSVLRGDEALTSGTQAAGWSGQSVTVPVRPLPDRAAGVNVCFAIAPKDEQVYINGSPSAGVAGSRTRGGVRIEYLRPGARSWWALAPAVLRRAAFGHATSGVWIVLLVAGAMIALTAIVSWLAVRGPS